MIVPKAENFPLRRCREWLMGSGILRAMMERPIIVLRTLRASSDERQPRNMAI